VFDDGTYLDLFGNDGEVGVAWLEGYLTAGASAIDRIQDALHAEDRDALRAAVHMMAGASLTVGAMRLGGIAVEFDQVALTAPSVELDRRYGQLVANFQATRTTLEHYMAERKAA
jgi:HPt (histidine-containing phosphotransfer) domain-containing protein